jgi:hypothetical protein
MEEARKNCRKIYLAHPKADDLRSVCKNLGRALHMSGLAVLPSQIVGERTLESKIQKWIEDAELSIHIHTTPADPLAAIQLKIAERAGTPIIVLDQPPREIETPDLVERVKSELSQTHRRREVYFIYDYSDSQHASGLTSQIETYTGRKIAPPQPGETYQQAKLTESDGIVLFRGAARESWFNAHREKLLQAAALRRGHVIPEVHYCVQPGSPPNLVVNPSGAPSRWEIDRVGAPNILDLRPFLDALQPSAAGAAGGPI